MGDTHYGADCAITGRTLRRIALCGRPLLALLPLLVLLLLLVSRTAGDLQERGMTLLHFGNNPAKMP